ncbi:MAG: ABC transporter substrate-binding protein [Planctomycetaceae bacterium]|nr:ABC transporter substrate-binding protein [Planctomycetaceae bacterium]
MFSLFRPLPWEYAVRNLFRRPLRTLLTVVALTTVVLVVLVVVGFTRGLERTLLVSGDDQTALVFSLGMGENLEYSSIPMRTGDLVSSSLKGIQTRYGEQYISQELYLGTEIRVADADEPGLGLVRGVTPGALRVRSHLQLTAGRWPGRDEVLVGQLVAAKLGVQTAQLAVGESLELEGRSWRISGLFSAAGSAFESEVWCRLEDLQREMNNRQDLSLVALTLAPGGFADLDLFCKQRLDLELQALPEVEYYKALQRDYRPVMMLARLVVVLVCAAGLFAGLNTMYGSVLGRIPELAMLQTIGFVRGAILLSLIQEGVLLASAASLLATLLALGFINGAAIRFTMGAFTLQIDGTAVLVGCGMGVLVGFIGALPPALRALRGSIVGGLRTV